MFLSIVDGVTRNNTQTKTQNHINNSFRHTRETPRSSNDWRKIEDIYTYYLTFFSLPLNQLKAHLRGEKAKQNTCSKEVFIPFHEFIIFISFLSSSYPHGTNRAAERQS